MTIVEFFEKSPFENMISCLTAKPDKLIFLGDTEQMNKTLSIYEKFLRDVKQMGTQIVPQHINKHDLKDIVDTLTTIIKTEKDCIFDITGGEDLLLLGCGIVFAIYRDQYPFRMQRFDLESGKIIDCDCDDEVSFEGTFSLTVEEMISLYGGIVVPEKPQPPTDLDKPSVDALWTMAMMSLDDWQDDIAVLNEFERNTTPEYDRMNISLDLPTFVGEITDFPQKRAKFSNFIQQLSHIGVITDLSMSVSRISYKYKDLAVRRCLYKYGDILEMKVFAEACCLSENGKPYFDSCHIGVNIDWDGVVYARDDTRNEIDVILMRGLTPIFISCKNGKIPEIELYKLCTVADRFGGKRAKKVLIATNFEREDDRSERAYIQRTRDMGVTFIPYADRMNEQEWRQFLMDLV